MDIRGSHTESTGSSIDCRDFHTDGRDYSMEGRAEALKIAEARTLMIEAPEQSNEFPEWI